MRRSISFLPGLAVLVFNIGWDMIGYQNPTLGFVLWAVSLLLIAIPAAYWLSPGIQRWLPLGPTPEERRRQQEALDEYRAQMERWLHDKDAPLDQLPPEHSVRVSAQERTRGVLSRLGPEGKGSVVRFLHKHGLIKRGSAIISLAHADLSPADLSGLSLTDASIVLANLKTANLSDARLCAFTATGADMQRGFKRAGGRRRVLDPFSMELSLPIDVSDLTGSDLSGAVLKRAVLAGCKLRQVSFAGADLGEADLRAADLRYARNLTQEQIDSAYGSRDQKGVVDDTLLPDHLEAPLKWKLPLKQQREVRQRKR